MTQNTAVSSNVACAALHRHGPLVDERPSSAARAVIAAIRAYKLLISPYFRGSCRFLPSCADYASEAVARHGFWRGSWLSARRLARCHPLCEAGHDPVPARR